MFQTLLIILLITLSGSVLTRFYDEENSPLVRLGAGNIIGSALFGLVAFLVGCAIGLTRASIFLSLLIAILPLCLLAKRNFRGKYLSNFKFARNIDFKSAAYYFAFFVLFYFFFDRAMFETAQGIYTGGSQNLGDLPFHLGAIFSFSDGGNLPPENPSFAFAKFTYPFMTDFIAACFVRFGAKAESALLWQNVTLALSFVVLLENFTFKLTRQRLAGKLAPVIFLFCGGLGFIIFFRDYWQDGRSLLDFLMNMPADYTIREKGIRWGNSLTTLFLTQRSILLGMPLTLIVLTQLWKIFTAENAENKEKIDSGEQNKIDGKTLSVIRYPLSIIPVGLLAGTLPLVHSHSLAVLFIVSAFLFFFSMEKWRVWLAFASSVAVIAVPELLWALTGSASRLNEFVDWNFGWDARGENIFIFWAKNLGLFIPLLLLGLYFITERKTSKKENLLEQEEIKPQIKTDDNVSETDDLKEAHSLPLAVHHLYFYLPFLMIFFISNLVKFAPWEWDNIKVLIYWYVASVPFVAWILAWLWKKEIVYKIAAAACLIVLTLSGALDVWRVATKQINYQVFSADSIKIAEQIKQKTAPNALFLNAPTYNSAVVLTGRRSLMRYSGHLSSYGIDYQPREDEVRRIYEGTALAETFLKKNGIEYVIISPEERANLTVNDAFFSKYPVIAEAGQYRVYRIKN